MIGQEIKEAYKRNETRIRKLAKEIEAVRDELNGADDWAVRRKSILHNRLKELQGQLESCQRRRASLASAAHQIFTADEKTLRALIDQ